MALAESHWRANPAVLIKDWGEELVVFCDTTGNTHLLDQNGAAIFSTLREAKADLSLIALAALLFAEADHTTSLPALEGLLEELASCELVQRVPA